VSTFTDQVGVPHELVAHVVIIESAIGEFELKDPFAIIAAGGARSHGCPQSVVQTHEEKGTR
jgi:hypothetical protein